MNSWSLQFIWFHHRLTRDAVFGTKNSKNCYAAHCPSSLLVVKDADEEAVLIEELGSSETPLKCC